MAACILGDKNGVVGGKGHGDSRADGVNFGGVGDGSWSAMLRDKTAWQSVPFSVSLDVERRTRFETNE